MEENSKEEIIMKVDLSIVKKGVGTVAGYAKAGCAVVLPIVTVAFAEKGANYIIDKIRYGGKVGYDDAIRAILNSDMYSSARKEAIALVKTDGDAEYYRSVIYIATSDMYSSAKVETIRDLGNSKKIEEKAQD